MCSCRDSLITGNMKLVYYLYNKLSQTEAVVRYKDDLISEGMVGLIKAADNFDGGRGIKFATYASMCINNQMLMFLRKLKKFGKEISLYQPVNIDCDGNELCLADVIEAKQSLEDICIEFLAAKDFLSHKNQRERKILLKTGNGFTQKQIADGFGISQSYVSRIIKKLRKDFI